MRQEIDYIDPDAEGLDLTDKTIVDQPFGEGHEGRTSVRLQRARRAG